jgi:hypothetical protein
MILNLNSIQLREKEISILISSNNKFIRCFSVSPVLPFLDDDSDEDMNDSVDNPQNNSDNEDETEPSAWHIPSIVNHLQGKSKDEAEQFFKDKEDLIRADSKGHEEELAEDYKNQDEDWYNQLMEEERVSLEKKLADLSEVKDDVLDHLGIEKSPSPPTDEPNNQEPSSNNSDGNRGSLLDDYADPSQFPADWTGGDD